MTTVRITRDHSALDSPDSPSKIVLDVTVNLADEALLVALLREQVGIHVGHSECQTPLERLSYETRVLAKLLAPIERDVRWPEFDGPSSASDQHVDDYSYAYRISVRIDSPSSI